MTKIAGKTVLVTGANRGIGRAYVEELLAAGAAKIYAAARNPESLKALVEAGAGRVEPVALDVTDRDAITEAARRLGDVEILVNNAGVAGFQGILSAGDDSAARNEMAVNYFGVFDMVRAFAPVLAANGGGAILNMSSIAGQVNFPVIGSYSASKAAVHSLTQSVRAELAAQGTHVVGIYPGPVDTTMADPFPMEKTAPNAVVKHVLAALEAGEEDIYPDGMAQQLHQGLLGDPKAVEKQAAEMLPA